MNNIFRGTRFRILLALAVVLLAIVLQSCVVSGYNNRNWRRTPPSTGHKRCGCLMLNPYSSTIKQQAYEYQA